MKTGKVAKYLPALHMPKREKRKKRSNSHDFYQGTASGTGNCSICKAISKHLKEKRPSTKI